MWYGREESRKACEEKEDEEPDLPASMTYLRALTTNSTPDQHMVLRKGGVGFLVNPNGEG